MNHSWYSISVGLKSTQSLKCMVMSLNVECTTKINVFISFFCLDFQYKYWNIVWKWIKIKWVYLSMGHENFFHFELSVFFSKPIGRHFFLFYSYSHLVLINLSENKTYVFLPSDICTEKHDKNTEEKTLYYLFIYNYTITIIVS